MSFLTTSQSTLGWCPRRKKTKKCKRATGNTAPPHNATAECDVGRACLASEHSKIWNNLNVTKATEYECKPEILFSPWMDSAQRATHILNEYANRHSFPTFAEMNSESKKKGRNKDRVSRCAIKEIFREKGEHWLYQALFGIRAFTVSDATNKDSGFLVVKGAFTEFDVPANCCRTYFSKKSAEERASRLFAHGWT